MEKISKEQMNQIAQETFGFTLEEMGSDSYDFFDNDRGSISVWALRSAIEKAYEAGRASMEEERYGK